MTAVSTSIGVPTPVASLPVRATVSGNRILNHADLLDRSARVASGLRALGVAQDDSVALCLRNDFAAFEASFGAGLLGACPVAVNWHSTVEEARYILNDCDAKVIIVHADLLGALRPACPEGAKLLVVRTPPEIQEAYRLSLTNNIPDAPKLTDWDEWRDSFEPLMNGSSELPRTVIYTSGTTGKPKGVRFARPTPDQLATRIRVARRGFGFLDYQDRSDEVVALLTGPIYHSAPNGYALQALRLGATLILQPRFDPEDFCSLVERHRITHVHLVPVMLSRLLALTPEVRARFDLSSLRFVVHAAAPCPPSVKRAMIEWLGPIIHEYYGGTETSIVTACDSVEWLAHPGTVGRAIPEATVRVVNAAGEDAAVGEVGEIICRIPGIPDFTYLGMPDKRREVDHDGYIGLGDLGFFDNDRYLHISDRSRDMIISGGVNIYPAEIEAELIQLPDIMDCAVFGIPDEEFGESVCVFIQPRLGSALQADHVREFLKGRISSYKIPKRIEFRTDLPREDSGKIFKRKLRDPFWAAVERRI